MMVSTGSMVFTSATAAAPVAVHVMLTMQAVFGTHAKAILSHNSSHIWPSARRIVATGRILTMISASPQSG